MHVCCSLDLIVLRGICLASWALSVGTVDRSCEIGTKCQPHYTLPNALVHASVLRTTV